jgi:hypothetical protein
MVQLGPSGFDQIDREELDDEQIIGCPSHSTHEAIILQAYTGVGFAVVIGDVTRRSKTSWKTTVVHGASEYHGTRPFGIEAVPVVIIAAPVTWVPCAVIPWAMPLVCVGSDRALGRTERPQVEKPSSEEVVPASGAPWVAFCHPSLGLAGGGGEGE